jgi:hypothetical protein
MRLKDRIGGLLAVGAALLALILLAAALPGLHLQAGQHFTVRDTSGGEAGPAQASQAAQLRIQVAPEAGLSLGYLIVLVLVPASVLYLLLSRKARKQVLERLVPVLVLGAFLMLIGQHPEVLEPVQEDLPFAPELSAPARPVAEFDGSPPGWLRWAVGVGVGVVLVLGAGVAVWLYGRMRRRPLGPLARLAEEAQVALDALQAGGDLREIVLRCYFEMSRVLMLERSLTRQEAMTPREFEERLTEAGLPDAPVHRLTRLFEWVRYGAKPVSEAEEQEALACLAEIVEACREYARQHPAVPAGAHEGEAAAGLAAAS